MKVIIAGSRHCEDYLLVKNTIEESGFEITLVVSGGARGVDSLGEEWADNMGIPVKVFPADWDTHGRAAGPIRNIEMAEYADALIAIQWPGSRGTASMVREAEKRGLKVYLRRMSNAIESLPE